MVKAPLMAEGTSIVALLVLKRREAVEARFSSDQVSASDFRGHSRRCAARVPPRLFGGRGAQFWGERRGLRLPHCVRTGCWRRPGSNGRQGRVLGSATRARVQVADVGVGGKVI